RRNKQRAHRRNSLREKELKTKTPVGGKGKNGKRRESVKGAETERRRSEFDGNENAASLDESKRRGVWLNDVAKTR
ncbi:MAG: hypothetical protein IKK39_15730, partial [Thermoguttaceae bacterium]|nr:hypothetical protein [Thermoguttaceae bacterium]